MKNNLNYILFFDTTNYFLSFCLLENKNVKDTFFVDNYQKHSENLNFYLKQFLTKFNLKLADLNNLYFLNGPGSYSGVRIALTFSKMLHLLAPKIHIYSGSIFDLFFNCQNQKNLCFYKIKPQQIYFQYFYYNTRRKCNFLVKSENWENVQKLFSKKYYFQELKYNANTLGEQFLLNLKNFQEIKNWNKIKVFQSELFQNEKRIPH